MQNLQLLQVLLLWPMSPIFHLKEPWFKLLRPPSDLFYDKYTLYQKNKVINLSGIV